MPLMSGTWLLALLIGGLVAAYAIDCVYLPYAFERRMAKCLLGGELREGLEFAAKKFRKSKYGEDLFLYGSYFIYFDAFCPEADPRLNETVSRIVSSKLPKKYSHTKAMRYSGFIYTAFLLYTLEDRREQANMLCGAFGFQNRPPEYPSNSIQVIRAEIASALRADNETEQLKQIQALLQKHDGKEISDYAKSILLFRLFQLSQKDEFLTKSLLLAQAQYVLDLYSSLMPPNREGE